MRCGLRFLATGQGPARRPALRLLRRAAAAPYNNPGDSLLPYQLYLMLPYLLSILALVVVALRRYN